MSESIILIPVPVADPIVGKWREKYDEVALHGIPSHITLLFPFKDPKEINEAITNNLESLFSKVRKFSFTLDTINTFPGVVYLEPKQREKFIELTEEIVKIFPENPPYEGKYPSINPHLTISQLSKFQDTDRIKKEISTEIQSKLPVKTLAEEVWLMEENKGEWSLRVKFPFID